MTKTGTEWQLVALINVNERPSGLFTKLWKKKGGETVTKMFLYRSSSFFLYSFSSRMVLRIIIFWNSQPWIVCTCTEELVPLNVFYNDRYVTKKATCFDLCRVQTCAIFPIKAPPGTWLRRWNENCILGLQMNGNWRSFFLVFISRIWLALRSSKAWFFSQYKTEPEVYKKEREKKPGGGGFSCSAFSSNY